jgi:hypothetical protein
MSLLVISYAIELHQGVTTQIVQVVRQIVTTPIEPTASLLIRSVLIQPIHEVNWVEKTFKGFGKKLYFGLIVELCLFLSLTKNENIPSIYVHLSEKCKLIFLRIAFLVLNAILSEI